MATLNWKGYTWDLTDGAAGVGAGFGAYASANITGPDGSGYITLKITNPSGTAPIGCEMVNQTTGLGYGTYYIVVGTDISALDKNIVFGNLFPFLYGVPYIELDIGETSAWDGDFGGAVVLSRTFYTGTNPDAPSVSYTDHITAPSASVITHRLIWKPGLVQVDTFSGTGFTGTNLYSTSVTKNVPTPSTERIIINLWVYASGGSPDGTDTDAPATDIVIRDFGFTALGEADSSTYEFRVTDNGTAVESYSVTPEWGVVDAASTSDNVTLSENISVTITGGGGVAVTMSNPHDSWGLKILNR
jgi:hypothetical protein